eukprot:gene12218-14150_t
MPTPSIHQTARLGAFAIAAVWLAVAGVLYLVFERIEQNRQASLKPYALSSGDLVIPRQRDGHFHVEGEVNRQPVRFLVDTGASHVSVSQARAGPRRQGARVGPAGTGAHAGRGRPAGTQPTRHEFLLIEQAAAKKSRKAPTAGALLDAACRIVLGEGLAGLTLRPLADMLGVSVTVRTTHYGKRA